jgi:hypothetical protein
MVKIVRRAISSEYKFVADVPLGSIFSISNSLYMKGRGRSECECNVIELLTGQLDDIDPGIAIDCVYPEAVIVLGREDK